MNRKRRRLETGKNILIVLLTVSAIYLLTLTPLVQDSGVLDLFASGKDTPLRDASVTLTAAARPARMAVNGAGGRCGVQYDQAEVDRLFASLGPLLGEALNSSGAAVPIGERQWQRSLQGESIYFDFSGEIPLSALAGWLRQGGTCALEDAARRLLLSVGAEDKVMLCYQSGENGEFYSCETDLSAELHLEPAIAEITGNDAQFAFEQEGWAEYLHPYTLLTSDYDRMNYQADIPLTEETTARLLEALGYTGRSHASVSGGELYLDGNDRLHVLNSGKIVFNAARGGKYPVAAVGETATVAEAIEAARELAESTIGMLCGEAELYLISAEPEADGYRIRFGYRLDGSPVWLYNEGWAAEFIVSENCLSEFTLFLRSYAAGDTEALLLPVDKAAVMLPDVADEQRELSLQYRDGGEEWLVPVWVAQ